jgi:hypothetical protein
MSSPCTTTHNWEVVGDNSLDPSILRVVSPVIIPVEQEPEDTQEVIESPQTLEILPETINKSCENDYNADDEWGDEWNYPSEKPYDEYDEYDEMRQDINGVWYTRRQFYDYYGSDHAWDNLDPDIYHQYRFDDQMCEWHTKEEFYQKYGTYKIWKRMHPLKVMERRAIHDIYYSASYISPRIQDAYIRKMLETYK